MNEKQLAKRRGHYRRSKWPDAEVVMHPMGGTNRPEEPDAHKNTSPWNNGRQLSTRKQLNPPLLPLKW